MCRSFVRLPPQGTNSLTFDSNVISSISKDDATEVLMSSPVKSKHCVQHNYHDHVNDKVPSYVVDDNFGKCGVSFPFPQKLYEMLDHIESASEPGLSEIISWQPHGRCFLVRKPKDFTNIILPRFFQQKKYASFQRQLNLYGFNRITKGPDRGSYYHELFLRGKPFLSHGIIRMKVKGTGTRMASNPETEPDFYSMPSLDDAYPSRQPHSNQYDAFTSVSSSNETTSLDSDDHEYVFDGMPFHLMEEYRRNSLRNDSLVRPSAVLSLSNQISEEDDDESFFKEMDIFDSVHGSASYDEDELRTIIEQIIRED